MTPKKYKSAREQRGTQAAVAEALGVDRVTIARRETGGQIITREAWLALQALPKQKPHASPAKIHHPRIKTT